MGKEFEVLEANPSEALKDLQVIENNIVYLLSDCVTNDEVEQCLKEIRISTIKQALLKAQELEKELTELNQHIKRWHDLLLKTGINSKGTVVDEIENYWTIKMEK